MCHRHSFSVTRAGKVLHGHGVTDSHTTIHEIAGLSDKEDKCNQYEWQPPKGWPNADWTNGLTKDCEVFVPKAKHLVAMEAHIREWYPDMAAWEAPDKFIALPDGLTRVTGALDIRGDVTLDLTEIGELYVHEGASLTTPALARIAGGLYVYKGASITAPALVEAGWLVARARASITAPALIEAGELHVSGGASITAPALARIAGGMYVLDGASITAPALVEAGWLVVREGASLTAPALAKAGMLSVHKGATLTAPALKRK